MLFAGPAFAKSTKAAGLAIGGNTIAGPGSTTALIDGVDVLADGIDEDICVTIAVNSGKSSTDVRLDLTDDNASVSSMLVGSGSTAALCQNNNMTVQVTCVGPQSCDYSWRVDRK
jgi:hypothetical protein